MAAGAARSIEGRERGSRGTVGGAIEAILVNSSRAESSQSCLLRMRRNGPSDERWMRASRRARGGMAAHVAARRASARFPT